MTQAAILAASGSPGTTTGFKNKVINGGMVIDQRNAGASISGNDGSYGVDRWVFVTTQNGKMTSQQNAGSVTPPVGFNNYLGITSSSAYSVGSTDFFNLRQKIEGYNAVDLGWGTANAKTVTLSFWVYSSLTGTVGGAVANAAFDQCYPFSYTISSANTWEQKSITVAGATSGTWNKTNGVAIQLCFGLGAGATYSGTAGSWSSNAYVSSTGATSVVGTNGATWYMTGCQFEVGTTATNFDFRSYGTELGLCQRYFESNFPIGTAPSNSAQVPDRACGAMFYDRSLGLEIRYAVSKRAAPTVTFYSGSNNTSVNGQPCAYIATTWTTVPNPSITGNSNVSGFGMQSGSVSGSTNYTAVIAQVPWTASAEL